MITARVTVMLLMLLALVCGILLALHHGAR